MDNCDYFSEVHSSRPTWSIFLEMTFSRKINNSYHKDKCRYSWTHFCINLPTTNLNAYKMVPVQGDSWQQCLQ